MVGGVTSTQDQDLGCGTQTEGAKERQAARLLLLAHYNKKKIQGCYIPAKKKYFLIKFVDEQFAGFWSKGAWNPPRARRAIMLVVAA